MSLFLYLRGDGIKLQLLLYAFNFYLKFDLYFFPFVSSLMVESQSIICLFYGPLTQTQE